MGVGAEISAGSGSSRISGSDYEQLGDEINSVVDAMLPPGVTVLVVSKGDNNLVKLDGRQGWHFPRDENGRYAGHYPADSDAAIMQLEEQREMGARYIVFPSTAFWWLEHYEDFGRYLSTRYRAVVRKEDTCIIFALKESGPPVAQPVTPVSRSRALLYGHQQVTEQLKQLVSALLPAGAVAAVVTLGDDKLSALRGREGRPFPAVSASEEGAAVACLGQLQREGAQFLIVPRPAFDWLDQQPDLIEHLEQDHRLVTRQKHVCDIYELLPRAGRKRHGDHGRGANGRVGGSAWQRLLRRLRRERH